jgi:hypothetical protein
MGVTGFFPLAVAVFSVGWWIRQLLRIYPPVLVLHVSPYNGGVFPEGDR